MSKIWILERFITVKEQEQYIQIVAKDFEGQDNLEEMLTGLKKRMEEDRPSGGHWCGYVGKSNYKVFCQEAIQSLHSFRRLEKVGTFDKSVVRILQAELIDDTKNTWVRNYTNGIPNAGVLNYLQRG